MSLINFEDYKENGLINWKRYDEAKVNAGEKCYICGSYISSFPNKSSGKTLCYDCKNLETSTEKVIHDSLIRCPSCKNTWDIVDNSDYECYNEGEHDIVCPECNHEFTIETIVEYSFTSPELIKDEEEKDEETDSD